MRLAALFRPAGQAPHRDERTVSIHPLGRLTSLREGVVSVVVHFAHKDAGTQPRDRPVVPKGGSSLTRHPQTGSSQ
jgi:hypothetical protein